jgi:hypothetical protein
MLTQNEVGVGREVEIPEGKREYQTGASQTLGKESTREVPILSEGKFTGELH